MALHTAEKLLEFGAVPITLSDTSGHIYEPDGIDAAKVGLLWVCSFVLGCAHMYRTRRYLLAHACRACTHRGEIQLKTILKIKSERGARIGRFIIASTSAKVMFVCGSVGRVDGLHVC